MNTSVVFLKVLSPARFPPLPPSLSLPLPNTRQAKEGLQVPNNSALFFNLQIPAGKTKAWWDGWEEGGKPGGREAALAGDVEPGSD